MQPLPLQQQMPQRQRQPHLLLHHLLTGQGLRLCQSHPRRVEWLMTKRTGECRSPVVRQVALLQHLVYSSPSCRDSTQQLTEMDLRRQLARVAATSRELALAPRPVHLEEKGKAIAASGCLPCGRCFLRHSFLHRQPAGGGAHLVGWRRIQRLFPGALESEGLTLPVQMLHEAREVIPLQTLLALSQCWVLALAARQQPPAVLRLRQRHCPRDSVVDSVPGQTDAQVHATARRLAH